MLKQWSYFKNLDVNKFSLSNFIFILENYMNS
jgi:hypothetical protein